MGGGKKHQREQDKINANLTAAILNQQKVSEPQKELDEGTLKTLRFFNRTGEYAGKPMDVTDLPGYNALESIYGNANAYAQQKRVGNPLAAFSRNANPMFAKQLENQNAFERYNTRATGLSEAVGNAKAQAQALAGQSGDWNMNRNNAYTNALMGQSQTHFGQKPKSAWDKFMDISGLVIGGAKAAGGLGWKPF